MKTIFTLLFVLTFAFTQGQETYEITWMVGISSDDASVTIEVGDTVLWTWGENGIPHSVVSDDPNAPDDFGSEVLTGEGETYEYTFTEATIFDYNCGVHSAMVGTITVEETMSVGDKFVRNLNYYPNPVQDKLTITSLVPVDSFKVFNTTGKLLIQSEVEGQTLLNVDLASYQKGLYFVEVTSSTNQKTTFKAIKK